MRPYKSAKIAQKSRGNPFWLKSASRTSQKKAKAACLSLHTYGEVVATQRRAAHTLLCNGVGNAA